MPAARPPTPGATGRLSRVGLARVRGDSMRPVLAPGDRLLVGYGMPAREGMLVLARFPDGTLAVKRAVARRTTRAGGLGWWLLSDNLDSGVDSRHRGVFSDEAVVARVLGRVWPSPGWGTPHPRRGARPQA